MNRPDFSKYVVHFTKDGPPFSAQANPADTADIAPLSAKERLFNLLMQRRIRATRMPWTNKQAVCFTECTWPSLLGHADRYSPYGIGFEKAFVFATGGGPAIYLPPHLLERQKAHVPEGHLPFHGDIYAFVTPFAPSYASAAYRDQYWNGKANIDFSHEREWRVAHDLTFAYEKIRFVIVETYEDMAQAPKELKDNIGRDNWIIMSNYRMIEDLWPQHML